VITAVDVSYIVIHEYVDDPYVQLCARRPGGGDFDHCYESNNRAGHAVGKAALA
jgi:hypothetical protein